MKSLLFIASLLLTAAPAPAAAEWVNYSSPDGRFQALFPVAPEESTQATKTENGSIPFTTCMAELDGGSVAFGIAYNDYPEAVRQADAEKVLDSGRDAARTNLNGKIVSEARMTIEGYPAREFTIEGDVQGEKLFYHARIVLVDTRLYQIQIVRVGATPVDIADAVRFFASFKPIK
jgi:hypothetical protein